MVTAFAMNGPVAFAQVRTRASRKERLRALYEAHHASTWRLLRRLGLDEARASDVTHEVFLVAMARLDDIEEDKARAFLAGTAVRIAKKQGMRSAREQVVDELPEVVADGRPDEHLEQKRKRALLDSLLLRLDEELRTVLVLHDVEGYTQHEVAVLLELPDGTAASRLRRAREAFDALVDAHLRGGR